MKVKELIEILKTLDQELEVITAGDDEGNSYRRIPDGWVSEEMFDGDSLIHEEDMEEYDTGDLEKVVCIG